MPASGGDDGYSGRVDSDSESSEESSGGSSEEDELMSSGSRGEKGGAAEGFLLTSGPMVGFYAQYFAVGIVSAGLPATFYGVFLGYLNVPAYVYQTLSVLCAMPWSFKFVLGAINDTMPIRGLNRVPYMVIGWGICALALVALAATELPPPYWCVDEASGDYVMEHTLPNGDRKKATPCNPEAPKQSGLYTLLMILVSFGYIVADVAADGLMVQYAKKEPVERRGKTQSNVYLVRTLGNAVSAVFVGTCMNGKLYNGSFSWSLSFNHICACLALVALVMVPLSCFFVREPERNAGKVSMREYGRQCWELLCGKACFFVILFCIFNTMVGGVSTTAGPLVKEHWAGVENFQNQMFSLVGSLLFAGGIWVVKEYFLSTDWRLLLGVTTVGINLIDSVFTVATIFAIVRNQYFYLGETVLLEIPFAAQFIVCTWLLAEMSDDGNEGLMYGLLTTSSNLGYPFANAISNQLFRLFQPALSDDGNYIEDTSGFRMTVFNSFLLSYGFSFLSLASMLFLPRQRDEALDRKRTWPVSRGYGVATVLIISGALCYSLSVNVLSMFPSTMCLEYAGGEGCDADGSGDAG